MVFAYSFAQDKKNSSYVSSIRAGYVGDRYSPKDEYLANMPLLHLKFLNSDTWQVIVVVQSRPTSKGGMP